MARLNGYFHHKSCFCVEENGLEVYKKEDSFSYTRIYRMLYYRDSLEFSEDCM